jgi:hypothetical protein
VVSTDLLERLLVLFLGYLVGVCEVLQNVSYVSATAIPLAQLIVTSADQPDSYKPIYWILFYLSSLTILIAGNQVLWKFNLLIGLVSLLIVFVYIFGSIQYGDFHHNAEASISHDFNAWTMLQHFPLASWFYIGVQSLPLCCVDCAEVKLVHIPLSW